METKEFKIQVPEGYEIDKENSTFECIKFKPIKKDITYKDICNSIFKEYFYINDRSEIVEAIDCFNCTKIDKNNAANRKQLERLLALNQLLNIAKYYNRIHFKQDYTPYCITLEDKYYVVPYKNLHCLLGIIALFNQKEDAQAVIDNPNFREILDTIYKD